MRDMDTTKIIALGLVAMGAVSTLGYYVCMGMGMAPTIEPTSSSSGWASAAAPSR